MGIDGNEKADHEAQTATKGTITEHINLAMEDALLLANEEIWDQWKTEYQQTSLEKGIWHYNWMNEPGRKIWCKGLTLNKQEITTLNRLRSGHTLTKERRYNWGWEPDEICEICEVKEDIQHLLYDCVKFNIERADATVLEYYKPLSEILKENVESELKQLVQFIKICKIQL